ncbi:MAG: hypothetical protein LBB67_00585 [Oscillospiraceae bacterium]|jgi:hypothetical protein|nr:hypothetical protein [Oscillospiraceae bacterium]
MAKKETDSAAKFEADRKKWQALEAKRRAKKGKRIDVTAIVVKIVVVLVVAAIVCGGAYIYGSSFGLPARFVPVLKVGNQVVKAPEWAFYFYSQYQSTASQAQQFLQAYGQDLLQLDTTISPFGQMSPYKVSEDSEKYQTWDDYFKTQTGVQLKNILALAQEAKKIGVKFAEADITEIDETMNEWRKSANSNGMSLSAFLRLQFAPGITEKRYRSVLENEKLVTLLQTRKEEEFAAKYTDAILQEEYNKAPQDFNLADYRAYEFAKDTLTAKTNESDESLAARQETADAEVKKKAEAFKAKATDEAAFLSAAQETTDTQAQPDYDAASATAHLRAKKTAISSYGEDYANWIFGDGRKAGDITVVETSTAFYVVLMLRPQYAITTVDYYSIPIDFAATDDGSDPTGESKAETKKQADELLKSWVEKGATAEAFKALIQENSTTESVESDEVADTVDDTTGFSEKVAPDDVDETAIADWIFAADRKSNDTVVVETSTGYAVLLFSKNNTDDFVWKTELTQTHVNEDYDAYVEKTVESYSYKEYSIGFKFALPMAETMCEAYVENLNASAY